MLTREDDVDAHALSRQGWTISAIARHLGHDRKTIRNYLNGKRTGGVRAKAAGDPFEPFVDYCRARLAEDPHLWATTLFDELQPLGFAGANGARRVSVAMWRVRAAVRADGQDPRRPRFRDEVRAGSEGRLPDRSSVVAPATLSISSGSGYACPLEPVGSNRHLMVGASTLTSVICSGRTVGPAARAALGRAARPC